MLFLYAKGFHKAVIVQRERILPKVTILHFRNVEPQHYQADQIHREQTPWLLPQPLQYNVTKPYVDSRQQLIRSEHVLEFDRQELHDFFNAAQFALVTL